MKLAPVFILSAVILAVWAAISLMATTEQPASAAFLPASYPPPATTVITSALKTAPVTFDPALATDQASFNMASQVYDTLVRFNPNSTVPVGGLAESWTVSPNGLVWTFTLRSGVKFHDNTDVDAAAVVLNFNRWWDPANSYHVGTFQYFQDMFRGFKGDPNCLLTGVSSPAAMQVQLTLSTPYSPLAAILQLPPFSIASPAAIQAGTLGLNPVGSGPFMFVDIASGGKIRLTANTGYWNGRPTMDNLHFVIIANDSARLTALQNGQAHLASGFSDSGVYTGTHDSRLTLFWQVPTAINYLGINRGHTPLDNTLVRQAIAHAIDKKKLVSSAYNPGHFAADAFLPPAVWGRVPGLADYTYDPALAHSLLVQAGYPNGLTTTLSYATRSRPYLPNPAGAAASIQADLAAVGITANITVYDWATYLSKVANGDLDLWLLGWIADYSHPDNFYSPHFCGNTGSLGPRDTLLCDRLAAALTRTTFSEAETDYRWVSQRIYDNVLLLPLAYWRGSVLARRNIVSAGAIPGLDLYYPKVGFATSVVNLPLLMR
jgi:peptide/nickel transport system substrate-binding protein